MNEDVNGVNVTRRMVRQGKQNRGHGKEISNMTLRESRLGGSVGFGALVRYAIEHSHRGEVFV